MSCEFYKFVAAYSPSDKIARPVHIEEASPTHEQGLPRAPKGRRKWLTRSPRPPNTSSYGLASTFAGANPHAFGQVQQKDLAVTDVHRSGAFDDRVDCSIDEVFVHGNLQTDLFQQLDFILDASIAFLITLLGAAA